MTKNVFQARADLGKNRLYLTFQGYFSDEEAVAAADSIIAETKKLKTGFTIITDIAMANPFSARGNTELQRARDFIRECGVSRVVRVVSQQNILSKIQFERMGKQAGYGVESETAHSLAEAERMLDQPA